MFAAFVSSFIPAGVIWLTLGSTAGVVTFCIGMAVCGVVAFTTDWFAS